MSLDTRQPKGYRKAYNGEMGHQAQNPPTPGPWRADETWSRSVGGPGERRHTFEIYTHAEILAHRHIATVVDRAEMSANARLIAAAPELLESCKELRDALAAAMRVIVDLDRLKRVGVADLLTDSREQRFVEELHAIGIKDGIGVRAEQAIQRAEGAA